MPSLPFARISNNPLPSGAVWGTTERRAELFDEIEDMQQVRLYPGGQGQGLVLDILAIEADRPCHQIKLSIMITFVKLNGFIYRSGLS